MNRTAVISAILMLLAACHANRKCKVDGDCEWGQMCLKDVCEFPYSSSWLLATDFTLKDENAMSPTAGKEITLSGGAGKPQVVFFPGGS